MKRFRVEVTTTVCHFIDATSEADAIAGALELVSMGARPAYSIDQAANVERVAAGVEQPAEMVQ